jgi:hypothetical protein
MSQGIFNFPDQPKGTTLDARDFEIEDVTTDLVSVDIVFEKDGAATITPTVTITSTTPPWEFTMNAVGANDMEIEEGIHTYAIRTIDENGEDGTEKYIAGTINITASPPFPEITP